MVDTMEQQGLLAGQEKAPPPQEEVPLGVEPSNEPIDTEIPEDDLFTRILVSGGEAILYGEDSGEQMVQLMKAGSDVPNSIGLVLSILISSGRNALVEQGNAAPMDLIFMPQGAAEILGARVGEIMEASPQEVRKGVIIAKDMIMDTDAASAEAGRQMEEGGGEQMPPEQGMGEGMMGMDPPMSPEQPVGLLGGM